MTVFKRIPGGPVGLCDVCQRDKAWGKHRELGFVACNRCMVYILDAVIAGTRQQLPRARLIRGKFVGIRRRKLL